MKYNPEIHHRRSIRLQGYEYSRAGAYFVTICSQNRECLFGKIVNGKMRLNAAGDMMERWYLELKTKFSDINCDAFVCMPNHVHFITINVGADLCVRPVRGDQPDRHQDKIAHGQTHRSAPTCDTVKGGGHTGSPLHRVVQWFKTMTTNEYIRQVKTAGWDPFPGKLWQRNYWEHIVRNESELNDIREYIQTNPARWDLDQLNPEAIPSAGEDLYARPYVANAQRQTHKIRF